MRRLETEVLVIGGGPVGLSTALHLDAQGVSCVLVERHPTTASHPKASYFNVRTMEILRQLGIADEVYATALFPAGVSFYTRIKGYKLEDYNVDNLNSGKLLFSLYAHATDTKDKDRYTKALFLLRSQAKTQPRTSEGGFWHKKIYPSQMWLDGLYMTQPFLAQFAGRQLEKPFNIDEVELLLSELPAAGAA